MNINSLFDKKTVTFNFINVIYPLQIYSYSEDDQKNFSGICPAESCGLADIGGAGIPCNISIFEEKTGKNIKS